MCGCWWGGIWLFCGGVGWNFYPLKSVKFLENISSAFKTGENMREQICLGLEIIYYPLCVRVKGGNPFGWNVVLSTHFSPLNRRLGAILLWICSILACLLHSPHLSTFGRQMYCLNLWVHRGIISAGCALWHFCEPCYFRWSSRGCNFKLGLAVLENVLSMNKRGPHADKWKSTWTGFPWSRVRSLRWMIKASS